MGGNGFTILIACLFFINSSSVNAQDDLIDSTENSNEGKINWPTTDPTLPGSSEEITTEVPEVGDTSATETPGKPGPSEGPTEDNFDDGTHDEVEPDDDDQESGRCLLSKCKYAYSQVICPENTYLKNYTHSGCKGPYLKFKCCGPKKGDQGPGAKYLWPPKMFCEWTDCQPTKTPEHKRCSRGFPNGKISGACDVYMASYRCCWWEEKEATENDLD